MKRSVLIIIMVISIYGCATKHQLARLYNYDPILVVVADYDQRAYRYKEETGRFYISIDRDSSNAISYIDIFNCFDKRMIEWKYSIEELQCFQVDCIEINNHLYYWDYNRTQNGPTTPQNITLLKKYNAVLEKNELRMIVSSELHFPYYRINTKNPTKFKFCGPLYPRCTLKEKIKTSIAKSKIKHCLD